MKKLSRIEKDRIEKDTCNLSATQKEIKNFRKTTMKPQ